MRIPILGNPSREPDSGLKQFSKMKFKASPREMQGGENNACRREGEGGDAEEQKYLGNKSMSEKRRGRIRGNRRMWEVHSDRRRGAC